jgi:hypothetical protein
MSHRIYSPDVEAFLQAQSQRLEAMSFSELSALPRSQRIPTPSTIRGLEFWIERRTGDLGGVRIEARACRRSLLIFLSCNCSGFEMLADGSLVPETNELLED